MGNIIFICEEGSEQGRRVRNRDMALHFVKKAMPFIKAWPGFKPWPRKANHTMKSYGLLTKNSCQTHTSHILVVMIKPDFLSTVDVVLNLLAPHKIVWVIVCLCTLPSIT